MNRTILLEGIDEIKAQFAKIPPDKVEELIKLDPTYKPGKNVTGKYGKWIVQRYWNSLVNADKKQKYEKFIQMYPDKIHPKTGQNILPPPVKPEIKEEDLYKVTGILVNYDKVKNKLPKTLDQFESLGELSDALSPLVSEGITGNKRCENYIKVIKEAIVDGFNVLFNNRNWLIGIPETYASSSHFKSPVTQWCTGYPNMYDQYKTIYGGKYYIILDKQAGLIYQFHFESAQFMNVNDNRIDLEGFFNNNSTVKKFFQQYSMEENIPAIYFNKYINPNFKYNKEVIKALIELIINTPRGAYNIQFPEKMRTDKNFIKLLLSSFLNEYPTKIKELKEFMLNVSVSWDIFSEIDVNIDKNTDEDKVSILTNFPQLFSGLSSYTNELLEKLLTSGNDIIFRLCLTADNVKKFNEDNKECLKTILYKLSVEKYNSFYDYITTGIIMLYDNDTLISIFKDNNGKREILKTLMSLYNKQNEEKVNEKIVKLVEVFVNKVQIKGKMNLYNIYDIFEALSDKTMAKILSLVDMDNRTWKAILKNAGFYVQKMLVIKDPRQLYFVDDIDPLIQDVMINKNKYNVRFIKNIDKKIKEKYLKKYPELKDFIRE